MTNDQNPDVPPAPTGDPNAASTPTAGVESNKDARTFGMLCHLLALCGLVGIPFGNILGPLVIWLIKKEEHPFVNDQGKESLNFQITMMIAFIVLGILSIIPLVFCVTIPLLLALVVVDLVYVILASMRANSGEMYRYPWALRLFK